MQVAANLNCRKFAKWPNNVVVNYVLCTCGSFIVVVVIRDNTYVYQLNTTFTTDNLCNSNNNSVVIVLFIHYTNEIGRRIVTKA